MPKKWIKFMMRFYLEQGDIPELLGYAAGYQLIIHLEKRRRFTIKETFCLKAEDIVHQTDFLN